MVLKTAPKAGISMLSGVASEAEVQELAQHFSSGELVRMMNLLQNTISGFTRSSSRRMDAELCLINLCQPELNADMDSVIARLTRVEEQVKTGSFVQAKPVAVQVEPAIAEKTDLKPEPEINPMPVQEQPVPVEDEAPIGFWTDVAAAVRKELNPALMGFFITSSDNAPLRGILAGDRLVRACENQFVMDIVNKPDILELVARKASAKLTRPVRVVVTDNTGIEERNEKMEQLLNLRRSHGDIIKIKEN